MTTNTDINSLAQRLRAAAEKATKGLWHGAMTQFNGISTGEVTSVLFHGEAEAIIASTVEKRDAEFIALANPINIQLILNTLEAAQRQVVHLQNSEREWEEANSNLNIGIKNASARIKELEAYQSVVPETLPCNVLLEPGLRFGKGIKTTTLLSALERRAEYEKEAKNETPEQKAQRLKAFFELMGLTGAQTVKRSVYDSEKWQLVPIEPTEDMIVDGFESEPHEAFSSEGDWREYQEMSGCSKAAHRAKLCWAAMLNAAPALQEVE